MMTETIKTLEGAAISQQIRDAGVVKVVKRTLAFNVKYTLTFADGCEMTYDPCDPARYGQRCFGNADWLSDMMAAIERYRRQSLSQAGNTQ
jgi:hypothetical protein